MAEIDGGSATVAEAGSSMADLASSVQQVGDIINQISDASAEQASGISDVSHAILQIDEMTQQNSTLVKEAAVAAEGLQRQALSLVRAVAAFRLDEVAQLLPPAAPALLHGGPRLPVAVRGHLRLASSR